MILRVKVTALYLALGGLFDKGLEHKEVFTNSFLSPPFPHCLARIIDQPGLGWVFGLSLSVVDSVPVLFFYIFFYHKSVGRRVPDK